MCAYRVARAVLQPMFIICSILLHTAYCSFCASDVLALGAFASAWQHGQKVPQDLSIIGFDDIEESAELYPLLTTIRQPVEIMVQEGLALLQALIAGTQIEEAHQHIIAIGMILVGLFLTGLGIANLFPLATAAAMSTTSHNTRAASARLSFGVGIAMLSAPLLLGCIADAIGIQRALSLLLCLLVITGVATLSANRLSTSLLSPGHFLGKEEVSELKEIYTGRGHARHISRIARYGMYLACSPGR